MKIIALSLTFSYACFNCIVKSSKNINEIKYQQKKKEKKEEKYLKMKRIVVVNMHRFLDKSNM